MPTAPPPAWVLTRRQVIGARIRDARTNADLTQEALAGQLGIDHKTIHRIEYATSDPTLTVLLGIAKACGVSLADLVRE